MRWTERQRAMLREIGVRLWTEEEVSADVAVASAADIKTAPPAKAFAPSAQRPTPSARPSHDATDSASRAAVPVRERAPVGSVPEHEPADWLVVGELLDPADPQQVQLLDNMLRAIGVSRSKPTRAGRASFVAWAEPSSAAAASPSHSDPSSLQAAIVAVAPRCILALGRAAAAALLGSDEPLGALRGRRHERPGGPVVVTFSLAFLLRHPAEKAKAWTDLCLAVVAGSDVKDATDSDPPPGPTASA